MFWIHPTFQRTLQSAAAAGYDAVVQLRPRDHFVEKQGRSTGRYVLASSDGSVSFYLKRYFRLPWWRRWLAPLDSFPGPRELANLQRVAALGVPCPEPLVAGADRRHPCHSLLAVRELDGFIPLHQFIPSRFAQTESSSKRLMRRELTLRLADIARRLHAAKLYHCDFYLCHFFLRESPLGPAGFDLVLIDLMRLKHSWLSRWQVKDLAQLLFSSDLPGVTRTDRLRFFKHYLGLSRLDAAARRLLRRIQRKASFYHRHNASLAQRAA